MLSSRSAAVAQSFGARAETYDEHADLQRGVAGRLARLLPQLAAPRVLELGCGTGTVQPASAGALSRRTFLFTDLAPSMVEQCRRNLAVASEQRVSFEIMDAARPTADGPFDLIATSMTLHWLADPAAALATLRRRLSSRRRADLRHASAARASLSGARCSKNKDCPSAFSTSPSFPASSMRSASSPTPTRSASCAA